MCGTRSHLASSCTLTSSLQHNYGSPGTRTRHDKSFLLTRSTFGLGVSGLYVVAVLQVQEEPVNAFKTFKTNLFAKSKGGFQILQLQIKGDWAGSKDVPVAEEKRNMLQRSSLPQLRRPPIGRGVRTDTVVLDSEEQPESCYPLQKFRYVPKKTKQPRLKVKSPRVDHLNRRPRTRGQQSEPCSTKVEEVIRDLKRESNNDGYVQLVMEQYPDLTKIEVSGILTELQQRHELTCTIEFFQWMKKQPWYFPNSRQYTRLIGFMGRLGKVDQACLYFQEMLLEKCKPDQYTFTAMLNSYGKARMCEEALAVFSFMKEEQDPTCKPTTVTCNALIDALVKGGLFDLAIKTFIDMNEGRDGLDTDCSPNVVTYNILIDALCKQGLVKAAIKVLYQMRQGDLEHAIMPNVATYNTLINACGKSGLYEKAEELMENMVECGVEPDKITYTALIDAYGKAGQCESAENMFKGMKGSHVHVDVTAYTAMIDAYAREGLYEKAENLFQMMCNSGIRPNEVTHLALMEAYGKAGLPQQANEVFTSMLTKGFQANVLHYSALIDAYGKVGMFKEAANVFKMMKRAGCRPNLVTLSAVLSSSSRCDSWDEAMILLRCLQQSSTELERGLCTLLFGEYSHVVEEAMTTLDGSGEPTQLRQSLYNSLMDVLWRFGLKGKAAKVFAISKQHGIYSDEYTKEEWNVDLHGLSVGGAMTALSTWLSEIHVAWLWGEEAPAKVRIITGKGKHSRTKTSSLKSPVENLLRDLQSPFASMEEEYSGFFAASGDSVKSWLLTPGIKQRLQLADSDNINSSN